MLELFEEGIRAANPEIAINNFVSFKDKTLEFSNEFKIKLTKKSKVIVIGAGKASRKMANTLVSILGERITKGIICSNEKNQRSFDKPEIEFIIAGHPYPTNESVIGGEKILREISNLTKDDLVLCLISGGGSALMEIPISGISLEDLVEVFDILTEVGANIHELNTVRKHLSQIKGGKLAKIAYPAKVISLIISDVVGDKIESIASGPTAPDSTSWIDVKEIIERYNLEQKLPESVKKVIEKGLLSLIEDTPKATDFYFANVQNFIIASNAIACEKMKELCESKGLKCKIKSTELTGEAKLLGREIASEILKENKNTVIIAGGETTVKIKGKGIGGRCQELVLAAGNLLKDTQGIVLAAIGSDGKDGPTDAAGGMIDGLLIEKASNLELNIGEYLENNNSYNYFKKIKGLVKTGSTGTNIMDLVIAIRLN
ncbi:MAG TPA: glycerate kinase [candidate division Zixibacteria bacterium]|nr:glycerate kinase [candidate division Zixibacteria bacterium]